MNRWLWIYKNNMGENGNPDVKITFLTCFSFIHIVSSALVLRVMDWWWLFVLLYSKPDSVDQDPTLLKSVCRASSSSLDLISLHNLVSSANIAVSLSLWVHHFTSLFRTSMDSNPLGGWIFFPRPYFHYSLSSFPYFRRSLSYLFVKVSSSTQAKSPFLFICHASPHSRSRIFASVLTRWSCVYLNLTKNPNQFFFCLRAINSARISCFVFLTDRN